MMLHTIWLKTLRDNLRGALGWGIGMGLVFLFYAYAFLGVSKGGANTPALSQMKPLLDSLRALDGAPVNIDSLSGYIAFLMPLVSVLVSVWALLSASAITRGEEERGAADLLLSVPCSRARLMGEKWLGFSLALLLLGTLMWLMLLFSFAITKQALDLPASIVSILDLVLQAWLWGIVAMAFAQVFTARAATAGAAAGLMLFFYFSNNICGGLAALSWLTYLSPFHYFEVNRLLAHEYGFDAPAFLVTPALALALLALASYMLQRRDIGAAFHLGAAKTNIAPILQLDWHSAMLGSVLAKTLRDLRWPALWWGLGLVGFCSVETLTAQATFAVFKGNLTADSGMLGKLVGNMVTPQDWLAFGVFTPMLLALPAFAITQVASWAGEEEDGRMEVMLTASQRRGTVLLARFAAMALVCAALMLLLGLTISIEGAAIGLDYDPGKCWAALIELLPLMLLTLAAGYALAAWLKRPTMAVAIIAALLVASYLLEGFGQILNLSAVLRGFSLYYYYGSPARDGFNATPVVAFLAVGLGLLGLAVVGFQRRDLAKG